MAGSKSSGNKSKRTLNWDVIVYPESAPENWRDILDETHIEWVESPLHDKDVNPTTGELKKPHWHVLLLFPSVKTFEQVCELLEPLKCPIPQRTMSVKGTVRYMAHLDNPEKYQYDVSKIVPHGGVDISDLMRPTASERYSMIREMCEFVKENKITEFQDLMDYAMAERFETWFPALCDNSAYVVGNYIKSQRHRLSSLEYDKQCKALSARAAALAETGLKHDITPKVIRCISCDRYADCHLRGQHDTVLECDFYKQSE